ncbi:MAG: TrkH family potassium uptake protein [Candidatus Omnitrophica bacterium]|nr:TrkH family potassium uptake protein [Candidatus Omnitrophota bacterium]
MLLKPTPKQIKKILYYLGRIIIIFGFLSLLPLLVSVIFRETEPAFDFIIGSGVCFIFGFILVRVFKTDEELNWIEGMLLVSLSWIVAMFLASIPLFLSRHYHSYLDACFEAMSGLATTGLTLIIDLEHLSFAHNFWRHLLMFIGGQGIVIVALSFLVRGSSGAFKMYVGEARGEKILPNVISTSRFIWTVSFVYLCLGTIILGIVGIAEGLKPLRSFFHSLCIFMAGFDTGGFSLHSQNIIYYHSILIEIITISFMILGAINFKLHYSLWTGNFKEIFKNIETKTFFFTVLISFFIVIFGLAQRCFYPNLVIYFRRGFYQLISAHTGTGFTTLYSMKGWPILSILGLIVAMGLGGGSCSTTGGIKVFRIGIIFKGLFQDIKRILLPESAVFSEKFHHTQKLILEDTQIRVCLQITLFYIILYFIGAVVGVAFGYPFLESLFESTSASANVGLSCGITQPQMPALLKIIYIIQMCVGRLEFISIFSILGLLWAILKGR